MLTFMCATYNEESELDDLFRSVMPFVDGIVACDDGSTDKTPEILANWNHYCESYAGIGFKYRIIPHTGLPETVKNEALSLVDTEWVLMLDCDERLSPVILSEIRTFVDKNPPFDYVYFRQHEIIDGRHVRTFQKCKLFKRDVVHFPLNNIHADDQFDGQGTYMDSWVVEHRKTTYKQIERESEYLKTYKRLLDTGKIDEGRYEWLRNLHHFVR